MTVDIRDLHQQAMDLAERADAYRRAGEHSKRMESVLAAFKAERQAADTAVSGSVPEPTRSILLRSAASLALECGAHREAERLVAVALAGEPGHELAEELRDLLEQIHFERHMSLRGVVLQPSEVQLSISGRAVGFGLAVTDEIVERVQVFGKLVYRTVERRMNLPYRDQGGIPRPVREGYRVLMSVPRAASFAVSLRVGEPGAQSSLGCEPVAVVDDIVDNLELLNKGEDRELERRIYQPAYLRNFVGLARMLAPSGEDVRQVGLTIVRSGHERHVGLTRASNTIQPPSSQGAHRNQAPVRVTGRLLFADSTGTGNSIKVVDTKGQAHVFQVPDGMMADIVRPLWDNTVVVDGVRRGARSELLRIESADA